MWINKQKWVVCFLGLVKSQPIAKWFSKKILDISLLRTSKDSN